MMELDLGGGRAQAFPEGLAYLLAEAPRDASLVCPKAPGHGQ